MSERHTFSPADGNGATLSIRDKTHPLGAVVFYALLIVILLVSIPYASADPWWEASLECATFGLAIISLFEFSINPGVRSLPFALVAPILVLIVFAFIQTLALRSDPESLGGVQIWRSISADPFATRLWMLKMSAYLLMGLMLARYTSNVHRLRWLIGVIAIVGVGSALFGIFRQTTQRHDGFLIFNRLRLGFGYAQFVNRSQFAYLAEMVLGIMLGLLVSRAGKREKKLIYLAASVTLWTALVLSVSRGAILAMLCQIFFLFVVWATGDLRAKALGSDSLLGRLRHSRLLRVMLGCALMASVLAGTIWMGGDHLSTRLENAPMEMNGSANRNAGISRFEIWRATWAMIKDHPIAGIGFGGYWTAIPQYHHGSGEATPQEAHNDYLELLASGGAIGFAFGLWFLFVFLRRAGLIWKTSHEYPRAAALGAATGIFGVAVHSLSDFGLHNALNATILTALIVIATTKIKSEHEEFSPLRKRVEN